MASRLVHAAKNGAWPFIMLLALPVRAQVPDQSLLTNSPLAVAWKLLLRDGITSDNLREKAIENIKKRLEQTPGEPYYDFLRVEVPGEWAPYDQSARELSNVFDKQLALFCPAGGELAARAKEVFAQLKDKEINQIVCYGWGSELVYQGICDGLIKPPRKIIVLAPLDNNTNKWKALQAKAGIDMRIYNDADNHIVETAGAGPGREKIPSTMPELEKLLDGKLGKDYNPHNRVAHNAATFEYRANIKTGGGGRNDYYSALVGIRGTSLFPTIQQLQAPQEALVRNEEDRILNPALAQAQQLIGEAKALQKKLDNEESLRTQLLSRRKQLVDGQAQDVQKNLASLETLKAGLIQVEKDKSADELDLRLHMPIQRLADAACAYLNGPESAADDNWDNFKRIYDDLKDMGLNEHNLAYYLSLESSKAAANDCQQKVIQLIYSKNQQLHNTEVAYPCTYELLDWREKIVSQRQAAQMPEKKSFWRNLFGQ